MKKIIYLLGIVGLVTTYSCSSTYQAGNNKTDDVYYSSKNQPQPVSSPAPDNGQNSSDYNQSSNYDNYQNNNSDNSPQADYVPNNDNTTYSQTDGKGNTYVTNNYNGDYYDYEYSSKIRRYYSPVYGYNYYDPYYTNSYWYNYNPSSWGVSIYLGYNWWAPSSYYYDPFCYGGFSIGYHYNPNFGYYPYCYGYGGPSMYGYNQGYYNGYHDGYYGGYPNPYYYNSYDQTSYYYGPRGSVSSNSPRFSSQRQSNIAPMSTKYEDAISDGRISRSPVNEVIKPDIINRESYNSNKEKLPQINKNQYNKNQNEQRSNTGTRNNTTTPVNKDWKPANNNQEKNNSIQKNNESKNSVRENTRDSENAIEKTKSIMDQNNDGNRSSRDRYINNPKPQNDPNTTKPNLKENQNSKDIQRINLDNIKIEQSPKQEEYNQRKKESRIEMPSRQENKTPVFTPRDQPKQYRQENAPAPQRSQPSQPAEHNNNGGRRK